MPIYMDLHIVPGVNAKDVADAHSMDVLMEKEHSCKCLTYWIDELRGYVFCLIDAPDKESVVELHARAHGLVPNKIIEVEPSLVHAFLGRITDPDNAVVTETGLKVLDDTSFRIILCIQVEDPILLREKAGHEKASALYREFHAIAGREIDANQGREVMRESHEMIASFLEGEKAMRAAAAIHSAMESHAPLRTRISLHAGEPVAKSDKLFGETVQMLQRMNACHSEKGISITNGIKELLSPATLDAHHASVRLLAPDDESFIASFFQVLETRMDDESFDMEECCRQTAMSQSQLYRRSTHVLGVSPNQMLRTLRLMHARDLLRTTNEPISRISMATGFSSPSYFSKCFKSDFGITPLAYQGYAHAHPNE